MAAIFTGPGRRIPETINLPVAAAYLPGLIVTSDGVTITQAASAQGQLFVLAPEPVGGQSDLVTAAGDTGAAYLPVVGDSYRVRAAAATYTIGQALTVNASGQVAAAATGNPVFAYSAEAGARTAGQLLEVTISDRVALA